jgi:hypothetical protein
MGIPGLGRVSTSMLSPLSVYLSSLHTYPLSFILLRLLLLGNPPSQILMGFQVRLDPSQDLSLRPALLQCGRVHLLFLRQSLPVR